MNWYWWSQILILLFQSLKLFDVVDVVINIKDRRFPPVRVKLKVKTRVYTATNLSQLNTALEQGIRTLKLTLSLSNPVSDKVLEDMVFIDSNNVVFEGCTLNNVSFIQITNRGRSGGQIIDGGENTFNNCIVDTNVWTVYDLQSKYAEMEFKNTRIVSRNCPLYLTNGTFNGCEINQCTLISDGNVTITNNTFNSTPSSSYPVKDYFPSSLYLTGGYTVKGNLFKLNDEWESPAFNMCIIKTVDGFNPSQFINDNSFDLNIIYDDEPTDTFYYNIVDDDKIYARRVS